LTLEIVVQLVRLNGDKVKKVDEFKKTQQSTSNQKFQSSGTVKLKFEGMIPEVRATFDFRMNGVDVVEFTKSRERLKTYVGYHFGNLQQIIESCEDYLEQLPEEPVEPFSNQNDPIGIRRKIYTKRIEEYVKREEAYNSNIPKLFNLIWGQCTEALMSKLRAIDGFDATIRNRDPNELSYS
jgi:hypothetical protein